ncbi:ECF-type sigma factor [Dokdonella sp.]|uniref:ECF-type sigma factor n=1 Tax=Dokdonella sp. TaxID=2291710 RepID=UPI001B0DCFE8|nr:ECF-type sigma factor [Dokdonella sp.]MBO9661699.1 sigma factor, ECF-like family protein [Dokdonella sp.]
MSASNDEVTRLIQSWQSGDPEALERLLPLVYADLRAMAAYRLAGEENGPGTLQPTALVHDVFLRMAGAERLDIASSAHLFHVAGRIMRNILVDRARQAGAGKRGGEWQRVDLIEAMGLPIPENTRLGLLDSAIEGLEKIDPRLARIVELRYFVGLSVPQVAAVLEVDERTVYRDWALAKSWLQRELEA